MDFDYPSLAEQFWQRGYLVVEGFFESALMNTLNERILSHYGEEPTYLQSTEFKQKSGTEVIPWFPQQVGIKEFDEIANNPIMRDLTSAVLGEEWQELYCMVMFSRPGTIGQSWHQDCPPEHPSQFNLNRLVYTHDINSEIGGQTVVVPGSHKKGVLPTGEPDGDMEEQVVLEPHQGTLVLLHGHTWHRVLPIHGRYRVSTNYRSCPQGVPKNVTDIGIYRNMRYRFSTSEVIEERSASTS